MALFLQPILRKGFKFANIQRNLIMSAQLNAAAEKAMNNLKDENPYYEKYAKKIATLQKTSPEEFLDRVNKIDNKKQIKSEKPRDYSELLSPKQSKASNNTSDIGGDKKLKDLMKIELLEDKSPDEIKHIWLEYHKQKDCLAAVVTKSVYNLQMKRGKEYSMFLVPLPRSQGFEFFLLQFSGTNSIHFTPLLCYQVHKENAPECLNLIYYSEFIEQDIILMRGEFDSKVINVQEAQCLVNQFQLYYAQNIKTKLELLDKFSKDPANFKHMDVIKELENLGI